MLFLCATVPMLLQALEVMASWGFKYVSHFIWLKDKIGTGYWNRNIHELLLVGVKGDIPCAAPGTQWDSVLQAPTSFAQRAHSEKPAIFYELIEAYFPTLPKIELNARQRRAGWDAWGYEARLGGGVMTPIARDVRRPRRRFSEAGAGSRSRAQPTFSNRGGSAARRQNGGSSDRRRR